MQSILAHDQGESPATNHTTDALPIADLGQLHWVKRPLSTLSALAAREKGPSDNECPGLWWPSVLFNDYDEFQDFFVNELKPEEHQGSDATETKALIVQRIFRNMLQQKCIMIARLLGRSIRDYVEIVEDHPAGGELEAHQAAEFVSFTRMPQEVHLPQMKPDAFVVLKKQKDKENGDLTETTIVDDELYMKYMLALDLAATKRMGGPLAPNETLRSDFRDIGRAELARLPSTVTKLSDELKNSSAGSKEDKQGEKLEEWKESTPEIWQTFIRDEIYSDSDSDSDEEQEDANGGDKHYGATTTADACVNHDAPPKPLGEKFTTACNDAVPEVDMAPEAMTLPKTGIAATAAAKKTSGEASILPETDEDAVPAAKDLSSDKKNNDAVEDPGRSVEAASPSSSATLVSQSSEGQDGTGSSESHSMTISPASSTPSTHDPTDGHTNATSDVTATETVSPVTTPAGNTPESLPFSPHPKKPKKRGPGRPSKSTGNKTATPQALFAETPQEQTKGPDVLEAASNDTAAPASNANPSSLPFSPPPKNTKKSNGDVQNTTQEPSPPFSPLAKEPEATTGLTQTYARGVAEDTETDDLASLHIFSPHKARKNPPAKSSIEPARVETVETSDSFDTVCDRLAEAGWTIDANVGNYFSPGVGYDDIKLNPQWRGKKLFLSRDSFVGFLRDTYGWEGTEVGTPPKQSSSTKRGRSSRSSSKPNRKRSASHTVTPTQSTRPKRTRRDSHCEDNADTPMAQRTQFRFASEDEEDFYHFPTLIKKLQKHLGWKYLHGGDFHHWKYVLPGGKNASEGGQHMVDFFYEESEVIKYCVQNSYYKRRRELELED